MQLCSTKELTQLCKKQNLCNWKQLTEYIYHLPYRRTSNRSDLSLVMKEQCGTCSGKHAFLMAVAKENEFSNVELHLALFQLNAINMPCLTTYLKEIGREYLLEAHCYLKVDNESLDVTGSLFDFNTIEPYIIEDQLVNYEEIDSIKPAYHKSAVKKWIKDKKINNTFELVWSQRENCIELMKSAASDQK